MTTRNRAILFAAGEIIRRHGGPWLIGGDFNCLPQDIFDEMAEWLKKIGGEIRAPGNLTCRTANGGRTIDFFILDRRLIGGVEGIWVQVDFPSSPHYMVVLRLRSTVTRAMVSKIVPPKAFDTALPIGCLYYPTPVADCAEEIARASDEDTIGCIFENLITVAEKQLHF